MTEITRNFRTSLTRAFREGAAHSLEPLQGQLQDIVTALRQAAGPASERPPGFFRRLRRPETGGSPPDDRTFGLQ